jgi:hypothetical protein
MTELILGPKRSKARHRRALLLLSLTVAVFTVFFVAGASGTLSGSTFSSANGKLDPTSPDTHDWNSPVETITCGTVIPGGVTNCGLDLVKDAGDNALGQGSKEDQTSVTVVDGQIPPSKDDLSRFYLNHDKVAGNDYLYLAWERSNLLGSAHLDFELNKVAVGLSATTAPGTITLNRTAGDKLIDFDFGGSGVPVLAVHTWLGSGTNATADCEIANVYPCWSKGAVLGSSAAESAVNSAPVTDTNDPGQPRTLDGNSKNGINSTFGEMGINLQAAGIFSSTGCTSFADAWVKSRSSGNSFGSELKDIIAPIPTTISNCGSIAIKKVTVPASDTTTQFSYSGDAGAQTLTNGQTSTAVAVQAGTYTETEAAKAGWDLTSLTCNDSDSTGSTSTRVATFHVAVGENVVCTYTNTQQGSIAVKKVTVPASDTTTQFSYSGNAGAQTLTNGQTSTAVSVAPGTYTETEAAKTGWDLTNISCNDSDSTGSTSTGIATFIVAAGENVVCTYTNTSRGALQITKQSIKSGHAGLALAEFSITGPGGYSQTGLKSDANGIVCVDGLVGGDYTVTETKAPDGYTIDNPSGVTKTVTATGAKCTDASFTGQTLTFNDTPKTDLDITVKSQDTGAGGSNSTITCTKDVASGTPPPIGNSPDGPKNAAEVKALGLAPGNYTCKVNIDP